MSKDFSARYYKKIFKKHLVKNIKIFLSKKKKKKQKMAVWFTRERYKNLSENEKQKLVEY